MGNDDYQLVKLQDFSETRKSFIEKEQKLLKRYAPVEGITDCYTCNNCGSGDCNSCCAENDD